MRLSPRHRSSFFALCLAALAVATAALSGCAGVPQSIAPLALGTTSGATPFAERKTALAAIVPSAYPLYSSYFKGTTPFHETALQLLATGAKTLPATDATNFWSQGLGNAQPYSASGGGSVTYFVHAGDPGYTFECPAYGGCSAAGTTVHYPAGATPSFGSDHHIVSFDTVYANGETDGWGGYGNACVQTANAAPTSGCLHPCNLSSGPPAVANCSYGGFAAFTGSGLGAAGNAAGYAYGLMEISAQDLLQGHIDHALGIGSSCLDDGGVFPAGNRSSDTHCAPLGIAEPQPSYGHMIHLKSTVLVAAYGYSRYCSIIVQALQTYGAYTTDTNGGYGISLEFEVPTNPLYGTSNPWTAIYQSMIAGGDGVAGGPGGTIRFQSCLQRIPASDIEVVQIPDTNAGGPLGFLPI